MENPPEYDFEHSALYLRHSLSLQSNAVYIMVLLFLTGVLCSLPFVYFDISVTARGIVRPATERTEIRPAVTGIIDTLFYHEGQRVEKNEIILRMQDKTSGPALLMNEYEQEQKALFIHDLGLLTGKGGSFRSDSMLSPVYRVQARMFLYKMKEQHLALKRIAKEVKIDSALFINNVIAPKEMSDKISESQRFRASFEAFKNEQFSNWQQDLANYRVELSRLKTQHGQISEELKRSEIRAPVMGTIQGINTIYKGSIIQAGESICTISPEAALIGECYIPSGDIGLLKLHQPAKFQMDAFNYTYFGTISGAIQRIDNDFSVIDNRAVYKVRCLFHSTHLYAKNGYIAQLKKGMTFQVRFIVARRNLWQLLFDKMDSWLNPVAAGMQ